MNFEKQKNLINHLPYTGNPLVQSLHSYESGLNKGISMLLINRLRAEAPHFHLSNPLKAV